jgi:hypothetical protein
MQSLFDQKTYNDVVERINLLSPSSTAQWGKMNVSQMLAHCKEAFKVPLSDKKMPRMFMGRLVGWLIKSKLYSEDPWKKNLPTAPNFLIKNERNFDDEKKELLALINKFYNSGPSIVGKYPHPFFGSFTPEQWGMSMYKHLDHHLRQFAV